MKSRFNTYFCKIITSRQKRFIFSILFLIPQEKINHNHKRYVKTLSDHFQLFFFYPEFLPKRKSFLVALENKNPFRKRINHHFLWVTLLFRIKASNSCENIFYLLSNFVSTKRKAKTPLSFVMSARNAKLF